MWIFGAKKYKTIMFRSKWMTTKNQTKIHQIKTLKIYFSTENKNDYSKEILESETLVEITSFG
jgi:hypothetical protein